MSVKKNVIYSIVYQILVLILPLVTAPYISRVIGAEGIGIFSYTYSIANYFILFAMLGLSNYGNRSIATVRDDKIKLSEMFSNIYGLQLMTCIGMTVFYFLYLAIFPVENKEIFYIQSIFVVSTILDINWFFFGLEQFKLTVMRNTLIKILTVISIFIFVKGVNDLWIYTLIMALGTLMSQILLWPFVKKYVIWVKPSLKGIFSHIKPNLVLFIPVLAVSIYKLMDKIMLGSLTNVIEVGYYENSVNIINIPVNVISALGVVMLPRMSNLLAVGDNKLFREYIETSLKFVMFISVGSTLGLIGISSEFIPLFFGKSFLPSIPVVSLLSLTLLFISWANVIRTQYLIPRQKDKIFIISTLLGAIVNVITNLIYIPSYGAIGATIGTILAEASVAIYQTYKIRKELDIIKYLINSCIYIIPAICMYFCILSLKDITGNTIINLILQIVCGGGIYTILSGIFLYILDKEMRERVKGLFSKVSFWAVKR